MTDSPVDPDLVAFLHEELDAEASRELRTRLAHDPALRAELAALRAADAALQDALNAVPRARVRVVWWRPLAAAAALAVTALLVALPRDDASAAKNDVVGLRVAPVGGAQHPVFTDVALEFAWQNLLPRDGRHLVLQPFHLGETLEALGRRYGGQIETKGKLVPMVVSATLHAPDGQRIAGRLADAEPLTFRESATRAVPLYAFEIETDAPPPYLGGRPGQRQWVEDFAWGYQHMPSDGPRRLLLDQIGEWLIELRVESVPPPEPDLWPTFAEPLVVAAKVFATGIVSDWGPTVDGMQARLMLATGCQDIEHAPLALQLRNVSDRTRRYNVVGVTQAEIPQPFHFRLLLGAEKNAELVAYEAREGLGVLIAESVLMVPHPSGTVRSLVVCPDYWRNGRERLSALPDIRTMEMQFHFRPTAWSDLELWQGELSTCRVQLPRLDPR